MKAKKRDDPLAHVQRLIKKLPAADRQGLIPFLASLPDSGLQSYNLKEELDIIQDAHPIKSPEELPPDVVPGHMFQLVIRVRNVTEIHMEGLEVLRVVFWPDRFAQAFPTSRPNLIPIAIESIQKFFTEERKVDLRAKRAEQGIQEDDVAFAQAIEEVCRDIGTMLVTEKGKRVAEGISLHLPRMIGDMFDQAIQGQTFADFNRLAAEMGRPEKQYSGTDLKKMLTKRYWEGVKPHLHLKRKTRTNPAWNAESKKEFAQRVSDLKGLTTRMKEVFDDCDGDDYWVPELRADATFKLLSPAVSEDSILWAIRRIGSEDLPPREREPLSIACEIARMELDLPEQDIETLRNYYGDGFKAIRTDRKASGK
jgi:hypothetical protein